MVLTPYKTKKRLVFVFVVICMLCTALTFRVGWVQIVNGDEYSKMAAEQQTKDVSVAPKRGAIYDRNGKALAISAATFAVWVRPGEIKSTKNGDPDLAAIQVYNTAADLALVLDMDKEKVLELISQDKALVRIAKFIDKEKADLLREKRVRGVEIAETVKRYYPLGVFAAHLLGSVTDDNNGLYGMELRYNSYLRGVPGRWIKDADIIGNSIAYGKEKYYGAEDGLNLVLTIDEVIQHYVEKGLADVMAETNADSSLCIVMDPRTGDILAMAALPDFDPNDPRTPLEPGEAAFVGELSDQEKMDYWNKMWRNPAINDVYEPGSTFKILTTAMALEEGLTHMHDAFVCKGTYTVSGVPLRCWRVSNPHGTQSLTEAFGSSCNPAFIQLVQRIGTNRFYQYLDLFGITEKTGVDFPGEGAPIIQGKTAAGPVGLATMSYGQGIAVTPIQLLTAVSCLGNEGKLVQPRIVKALTDMEGNVIEEIPVKIIRQAISKQTAADMCLIMEKSVAEGGGTTAKIPGYRIGGKTGTAIKATSGTYVMTETDSSFIGMAPMDNPRIAILLVVNSPKGVVYGSQTAAPGARQILADTLRYLNIQPEYTQAELAQMNKQMATVPDITGKGSAEAVKAVEAAALLYAISPAHDSEEEFIVVDQYPKAGEKLNAGGTVYIYKQ